jgi:hypothetical protein
MRIRIEWGTGDTNGTWHWSHMLNCQVPVPVLNEPKVGHAKGCLEDHHLQKCFGQTEDSEGRLNAWQLLATSVKSELILQRQRVDFVSWTRQLDGMGRMNGESVGGNCEILCLVMAVRDVEMPCDAWGGLGHYYQGMSKECPSHKKNHQMTFPA